MKGGKRKLKRTAARIYTEHVLRYPWYLTGVIVSFLAMQAFVLTTPWFLRSFVNTVAESQATPEAVHLLMGTLVIIVSLWLLEWVAHRAGNILVLLIEIRVMRDLFASSFDYLLGHSYNFFISNFAGSITHKASKFARSFELLFDGLFANFLPTFAFIMGAIVILFQRNEKLGLFLAVWTVCYLAFQFYIARWRQPIRLARAEADTRVTGNLADVISNQGTVALFSGAGHEAKRFARTVADWRKATMRSWVADVWTWAGIGLFMIVIQAVLFYVGIQLWQQGLFTVGDFVLVQAYLLGAFGHLERVNQQLRRMGDAYSDAQEMAAILDTLHEIPDKPGAKPLVAHGGAIAFKNVNFHFHEEKAVFEDFELNIAGGEKVALIGPSGAGKSTIVKLLLRLFDVKGGAVEIDGQNIAEVTQESLREHIAFVPQEPILFHRTLMENIRYGRRDATDEEVIEAAEKAHCHEFISKLPLGYETYVGERGVKLSGGERQRVAIARAILKNAPILVLDEATSSLDSESEMLIQDALATLMHGKTVIVIAHRLSTIMKMDRIIGIENGHVIEEGTHQELLAKKGLYAKLWSHQAGGFLQDE